MDALKFNIHGSEDSLDIDVFVEVDDHWMNPNHKPNILVAECTRLAGPVAGLIGVQENLVNCNICVVRDGVIVWCAKGDATESNNALLRTYSLHRQQKFPCFVQRTVERNVNAKIHRAVRGVLGTFTRTQYRVEVKACLRSKVALRERVRVLKGLDLSDLVWESSVDNAMIVDELKRAAFQTGQLLLLLRGVEVFTKSEVSRSIAGMEVFMKRAVAQREDMQRLQQVISEMLDLIIAYEPCVLDEVEIRHYGGTGDNGAARSK